MRRRTSYGAAARAVSIAGIIWCLLTPAVVAAAQPQAGLVTTPNTFQTDLAAAQELGAGILRLPIAWQTFEPSPGQFDWSQTDRAMEAAQAHGVELLFLLRSISSWGTTQRSRQTLIYRSGAPPADLREWSRALEALAQRYRGRGVRYEIENEVAGQAFWSGTLEDYLALLQASYAAIKQADPQATVLPSAMGCGVVRNAAGQARTRALERHDQWLRAILATKAFDAVSVHDYYFPSDIVANGLTFQTYLQHVRQLMEETGTTDRPLWVTENGYVSQPTQAGSRRDESSPQQQARWLTEAYQEAAAMGVARMFWLLVRDRQEPYFGSMGLADARGRHRPAWDALRQLTR